MPCVRLFRDRAPAWAAKLPSCLMSQVKHEAACFPKDGAWRWLNLGATVPRDEKNPLIQTFSQAVAPTSAREQDTTSLRLVQVDCATEVGRRIAKESTRLVASAGPLRVASQLRKPGPRQAFCRDLKPRPYAS